MSTLKVIVKCPLLKTKVYTGNIRPRFVAPTPEHLTAFESAMDCPFQILLRAQDEVLLSWGRLYNTFVL